MSQNNFLRLQLIPPDVQLRKWFTRSDLSKLSKTSRPLSQIAKDSLQKLRQQQYRKISSTLGNELRKFNIQTDYMAPEIIGIPTLPIDLFTSVAEAREKLLPVWEFKQDRLVFSKKHKKFFWLLSGIPYQQIHPKYLMKISENIQK
jgi:hypothetical protein